jgi:hypothetical protein
MSPITVMIYSNYMLEQLARAACWQSLQQYIPRQIKIAAESAALWTLLVSELFEDDSSA